MPHPALSGQQSVERSAASAMAAASSSTIATPNGSRGRSGHSAHPYVTVPLDHERGLGVLGFARLDLVVRHGRVETLRVTSPRPSLASG
ncbi:MAG TPA: hypothetical protein VF060_12745 [Trebonia sp.]